MSYITPQQVISRWTGEDAPDAEDQVLATLVEDAEAYADWKFPTLQVRVTANQPPLRIVQMVLSQVIQRAYQTVNNGLSSYSYGSGPFSESGSYGANSNKQGTIYFTQDEVSALSGNDVAGVFKVNLDVRPVSVYANDLPYANYSPYAYIPGEANNGY